MRRHVVLLTYGEPPTPNFLAQLRYSWRILLGLTRSVAPIPAALLPVIAVMRARARWQLWTTEHYGSPLEPITREQARGVAAALAQQAPGIDWQVHVAYEFRDPLLLDCVGRIPASEPVDIVPMYVADSAFTHEIARATLRRWTGRVGEARAARVRVMPALDGETFAELSARYVSRELDARGIGGPQWGLVLAAHGTLLEPKRPIETGRVATERVCEGIARRLAPRFGRSQIGWLNHVYGGRWTEPPADEALKRLVEAGCRHIVYYPFGFSADNAESMLEGRMALRTQPGIESVHLPCLNADAGLAAAIAAQVVGASGLATQTPAPQWREPVATATA